jgi:hypothetical protein
MPGYLETAGGPLSKEQVDSLVKYLSKHNATTTTDGSTGGVAK